jgi:enoyl-CoA hydratase
MSNSPDNGAVSVSRKGQVALITLDRPKRKNAFGKAMWESIALAAENLTANVPRAVVITGAGDFFCAGMDVNPDNPQVAALMDALQTKNPAPMRELLRQMRDSIDPIFELPVPIIAAVNGGAYGGGAELASRCDLRVMDENAVFCFSEVSLGLMPDWGGGVAITRLLGPSRAADLVLTARKVGAAEALALGLANRVVPAGKALEVALELAQAIAANGPLSVRAALAVIRETPAKTLKSALALELELAAQLIADGECIHGVAAFFEKKKPVFPDPQ